jgi:hypothetical protein
MAVARVKVAGSPKSKSMWLQACGVWSNGRYLLRDTVPHCPVLWPCILAGLGAPGTYLRLSFISARRRDGDPPTPWGHK